MYPLMIKTNLWTKLVAKKKKTKKEVSNYQKSSTWGEETELTKENSRIVEKISAKTFSG